MKTIGLLGGMSWESTVHYYQIINEEVKNKLGGLHSAKIILYSVEFAEIEVIIPDDVDVDVVNRIIFEELCVGKINEKSRKIFQKIIEKMQEKGAEGVILGCTEIGLLIHQSDVSVPVFDTTVIHAKKAVQIALTDR